MFGVYTDAATIFCRTSEPSPLQLRRDTQSWRLSANLSSHQAMPIRSVFPPSSPVPFFRSCFHSTIRQARNRLFCEVPSALRHCHFPKARLTSILRKIGKSSTAESALYTNRATKSPAPDLFHRKRTFSVLASDLSHKTALISLLPANATSARGPVGSELSLRAKQPPQPQEESGCGSGSSAHTRRA